MYLTINKTMGERFGIQLEIGGDLPASKVEAFNKLVSDLTKDRIDPTHDGEFRIEEYDAHYSCAEVADDMLHWCAENDLTCVYTENSNCDTPSEVSWCQPGQNGVYSVFVDGYGNRLCTVDWLVTQFRQGFSQEAIETRLREPVPTVPSLRVINDK